MPFFFMLSSFFISSSIFKIELRSFAWKQFWQMIYPMIVWYYIFLSAKIIAGGFANEAASAAMYLESPIPGQWHYWFLWALFMMRVGIFVIRPILENSRYFDVIILGLVVGLCLIERVPQSEWVRVWFSGLISFGPYFLIGILLGKYNQLVKPNTINMVVATLVFISLALSVSFLTMLGVTKFPIAVTMCVCCVYIFKWMALQTGRVKKIMDLIAVVGVLSMPVYLAHPIFSSITRELLVQVGITSISLQFIIGSMAGVVCSLVLYHLSSRIKMNTVLGFNLPNSKK